MTPEQHEIERRRAWVAFAIERAKTAQPFERQEKTPMVGGYSKVAVTVSMQAAGFANDMLAAYDARFPAPVEREVDTDTLNDKIDGLSSDLDGALDQLAWLISGKVTAGQARKWMGLNYPGHRATLSLATPTDLDWIDHTPGDPMPVLRGTRVDIKMKCGRRLYGVTLKPDAWEADLVDPGSQIIQWKPAQ